MRTTEYYSLFNEYNWSIRLIAALGIFAVLVHPSALYSPSVTIFLHQMIYTLVIDFIEASVKLATVNTDPGSSTGVVANYLGRSLAIGKGVNVAIGMYSLVSAL